jgi:tRNA(Ile)-lysidine synthase
LHSEDGWKALVDRTYLLVKKLNPSEGPTSEKAEVFLIEKGDLMLRLPDSKPLFFMPSNPAPPYPNGKDSILVDAGRLKYPLLIRHWQNGDSFAPFGLDGQQQKLQDYFTNEKLSKFEKSEVWLLLNGDGKIIWVMGLRMDERFRIGEETKEALKIEWTR